MQNGDAMSALALPNSSSVDEAHRTDELTPTKRRRRFFEPADKLRILQEAMQISRRGDLAALLLRESIYSSHLSAWKKAYRLRGAAGLEAAKPGRKPKLDWRDRRIRELEHRIELLERELVRANGSANSDAHTVGASHHTESLPP